MLKTFVLLAVAALSLSCSHIASHIREASGDSSTAASSNASSAVSPAASPGASPSASASKLREQLEQIASGARGHVGAAVMIVETGETVVLNGEQRFPMQSVYKLPISMAVLSQVDGGTLKLEQMVRVEKSDFVSEGQRSPIRDKNPRGTETSVEDLLQFTIVESDGTASDVLMRLAGGPQFIMKYLRELGVEGVTVANTEKEFGEDRSLQYLNWATPQSMLFLLRSLQEGRGLSAQSRTLLLRLMTESVPGPRRIKGRLPAATPVAHKTGSSGTLKGITAATNDVGLITLPNGRHLAIAVFVSDSPADDATREDIIAQIARAAFDWSTQ